MLYKKNHHTMPTPPKPLTGPAAGTRAALAKQQQDLLAKASGLGKGKADKGKKETPWCATSDVDMSDSMADAATPGRQAVDQNNGIQMMPMLQAVFQGNSPGHNNINARFDGMETFCMALLARVDAMEKDTETYQARTEVAEKKLAEQEKQLADQGKQLAEQRKRVMELEKMMVEMKKKQDEHAKAVTSHDAGLAAWGERMRAGAVKAQTTSSCVMRTFVVTGIPETEKGEEALAGLVKDTVAKKLESTPGKVMQFNVTGASRMGKRLAECSKPRLVKLEVATDWNAKSIRDNRKYLKGTGVAIFDYLTEEERLIKKALTPKFEEANKTAGKTAWFIRAKLFIKEGDAKPVEVVSS